MSRPGRRILLVSYHFGAEGATGGFRWHGLARELVKKGWAIDVITAEGTGSGGSEGVEVFRVAPGSLAGAVLGRVEEAPGRIRRLRSPAAAPAPIPDMPSSAAGAPPVRPGDLVLQRPGLERPLRSRLMDEVRALRQMADDRRWVVRATSLARSLAGRRSYRCLVVSSPPHGTQAVGLRIGGARIGPWIADLRDPMAYGLGPAAGIQSAMERRRFRRLEGRLLREADLLLCNTRRHLEAVAAEAGPAMPDAHVIRNGYDGEEPPEAAPHPDPEVFRVSYAGWLHPFMDPRPLLAGVARLVEREGLAPDACRLEFVGTDPDFAGRPLAGLAAAYGLERHLDRVPRVPRSRALEYQARASVLAAFDCLHPLCIPMKFFDYARMRGRLLLIGHPDGAMADAAAEIGVEVCDPDDPEAVDRILSGALEAHRSGNPFEPNDPGRRFHRSRPADVLHRILEGLP